MTDNPFAQLGALDQKLFNQTPKLTPQPTSQVEKEQESPIKSTQAGSVLEKKIISKTINNQASNKLAQPPKTKEIRITLPLPTNLLSFLDQMERDIFVRRSVKSRSKQRLTKNSITRAWLSLLQDLDVNINNIENEEDLSKRLKDSISKNRNI